MTRRCLVGILFFALAGQVFTQTVSVSPDTFPEMNSSESGEDSLFLDDLDERLQTIQSMLDKNERGATGWWYAWIGIYGAATLGQGAVACLSDDKTTREDMILGAGTTLLGAAGQLIAPVKSGYNPNSFKQTASLTYKKRLDKLKEAEAMLKFQAERAKSGKNWQTHALSTSVNLASGLITWLGFKRSVWAGLGNFALNTVVTEIQIWTEPTKAMKDYQRYSSLYGLTDVAQSKRPVVEWYASIQPNGIRVGLGF